MQLTMRALSSFVRAVMFVFAVFFGFFCGAALHLPATFITVLEQLAGVANLPPTQHRRPPSQHAAGHLPQPS